jgi:hypothetical protein
MGFTVSLVDKKEAKELMQLQGVTPRKDPAGPVLAVAIGSEPGAVSFRGEQINIEMLLKSSFMDTNRSKKKVMTAVDSKVVGIQQDEAGKPVAAYLEASTGIIKALANSQIVNFTRADELAHELKELSPPSAKRGGRGA